MSNYRWYDPNKLLIRFVYSANRFSRLKCVIFCILMTDFLTRMKILWPFLKMTLTFKQSCIIYIANPQFCGLLEIVKFVFKSLLAKYKKTRNINFEGLQIKQNTILTKSNIHANSIHMCSCHLWWGICVPWNNQTDKRLEVTRPFRSSVRINFG
jgi:hypothetical protein